MKIRNPMRQIIVQVELAPREASLKGVRRKLGLKASQIDRDYGVKPVRPEQMVYAVRVNADIAQRLRAERGEEPSAERSNDVRVALVH